MEIEFDPVKDAANIAKHGVSLAIGAQVIENELNSQEDFTSRGEARFNAFGFVGNDAMVCTYTMRGEAFRIISVRYATRQEIRRWLW